MTDVAGLLTIKFLCPQWLDKTLIVFCNYVCNLIYYFCSDRSKIVFKSTSVIRSSTYILYPCQEIITYWAQVLEYIIQHVIYNPEKYYFSGYSIFLLNEFYFVLLQVENKLNSVLQKNWFIITKFFLISQNLKILFCFSFFIFPDSMIFSLLKSFLFFSFYYSFT